MDGRITKKSPLCTESKSESCLEVVGLSNCTRVHCQLSAALPEQMGRCKTVMVRDLTTVLCQPHFSHKVS